MINFDQKFVGKLELPGCLMITLLNSNNNLLIIN